MILWRTFFPVGEAAKLLWKLLSCRTHRFNHAVRAELWWNSEEGKTFRPFTQQKPHLTNIQLKLQILLFLKYWNNAVCTECYRNAWGESSWREESESLSKWRIKTGGLEQFYSDFIFSKKEHTVLLLKVDLCEALKVLLMLTADLCVLVLQLTKGIDIY